MNEDLIDEERPPLIMGEAPSRPKLKYLHEDFARINLIQLGRPFNPATLRNPKTGKRWTWDPLPGAENGHVLYARYALHSAAIVTEPEDPEEVEGVLAFADKYGLLVSSPPNPWASLRNPGVARFMVLAGFRKQPIRFLPEQLAFTDPLGG